MAFKISDAYVDVEFRVEDAEARISRALAGKNATIRVDVDTRAADSTLTRLTARASRILFRGDTTDIDRKTTLLQAKMERITGAVQTIPIGADTTPAERKIDQLAVDVRRKLTGLDARQLRIDADTEAVGRKLDLLESQAQKATGDRRLKVDADIAAARAKLAALDLEATQVADRRAEIQVDADTAAAQAELAAAEVATSRLDGRRANVSVDADVGAALAKIALVSSALAGLGGIAVAGVGAAAGVGAVAAGGIGAFAASLTGVGGAVKALGEANKAAGGSAGGSASNHNQLASAMDRVKLAQAALKNARLDAASAERRSAESVADAARRLDQAREDGARSAQSAAQRVAQASAREQAAVESLQRAQEDLTRARKDAARQIEDLESRTRQLGLAERAAQDGVEDAKRALDRLGSRADAEARERAQLAYEEALARLDDIRTEQQRTAEDKADADKKGVEGSDLVTSVQERILQIQQEITAAQEATNAARAAESDAADKAAAAIQDAQRRVTETTLAAADQRRRSEASVAQSAQAVVEAQRAVQNASQQAGSGGAAAMNKLDDAMEGLTPTAQAFARYLRGFLDGPVAELRATGQENMLPGLQRGLEALEPILERRVTPALGRFSRTLGDGLEGAIPIAGRLAASILNFGTVSLRGLSPLGPVLDRFATRLDETLTRLEQSGDAEAAMGALVDVIEAFVDVIPPIIEGSTELLAALGPGLTAVAGAFGGQLRAIVDLLVAVSPELNVLLQTIAPLAPTLTAAAVAMRVFNSTGGETRRVTRAIEEGFRGAGGAATDATSRTGRFAGFLGGPWGLALTGATILLGHWLQKHMEAKQRVSELTRAIEQDAGAFGENTRAKVVNTLETEGVLKAAQALGISLTDVTESMLGNADAQARVNAALAYARDTGVWDSGDIAGYARNLKIVQSAMRDQTGEVGEARDAYLRTREASGQYGDSLDDVTRKSRSAESATDRLNSSVKKVTDGFLAGRDAEVRYNDAVARATAAVAENGRGLDVHTQKGRTNRTALDDQARASLAYVQSLVDQRAPALQVQGALDTTRAKLVTSATQFGLTRTEAEKYAQKILGVPPTATTTVKLQGVAAAVQQIAGLTQRIAIINGQLRQINIQVGSGNDREDRTPVGVRALGGPVEKGKPYIVGEQRPELFVPDESGTIIPDLGLLRRGAAAQPPQIQQVGGTTPRPGVTINGGLTVNLPTSATLKDLSPAELQRAARVIRDEIQKLEGATR